ncbi:hypothetical protein, partial [Thalassolituus marinus]
MWDWLKFFPYAKALDERPVVTEIRGPYFTKPRQKKWIFGDLGFYFSAPPANPVLGLVNRWESVDSRKPGLTNILKGNWERVYSGNRDAPPDFWDRDFFYENTWYFVGPWFVGRQADLSSSALLISADKNSRFLKSSMFHPKVFEMAIADYLDTSYGYRRSGNQPDYRGPLNWRVLPLSETVQGVVFDIHQIDNNTKDNPLLRRLVFFPVSDHQFVRIIFNFGGVEIYRDKMRTKPLMELCDSIINSMHMTVGESTLAKWNKVKEECPDMS